MGARFRIPIAFVEGLDTGDGRHFRLGQWQTRALPLSLMALFQEPEVGGHGGAHVVGRIDTMSRVDITADVDPATGRTWGDHAAGQVWGWAATGELADTDEGRKAEDLIRGGFLRGVSADLAEVTWEEEVIATDADGWPTDVRLIGGPGMIGGATVCNVPAFRACTIELVDEPAAEVVPIAAAGRPWLPSARETDAACVPCREADAVTASGGPLAPPAAWFDNPALTEPTPLRVDDDGRVFGHLAAWGSCHTGYPGRCVTPPRSLSGYSLFRVGAVRTAEGDDVAVGHITLGGGHADLRADTAAALAHYDDAGTAVADVAAGEDEHGIWVAGALRPDVTPEQVRALRAAPLSGDWRRHGSGLELVAALAVNVPGFPVVRSVAASGAPLALVAAGARPVIEAARPTADVEAVRAAVRAELAPVLRRDALRRLREAGVRARG
jgi:hypothetical protein